MYLAASPIAGRGVFASRPIRRGQLILIMRGKRRRMRYRTPIDLRIGANWVPIAKDIWIEPVFPIRFMNHCCEPNAGFKSPRHLYAMRDIMVGEEITIDYSAIEYVRFWSMPCSCGASRCRGTVRSVHFLTEQTYQGYLPFVPRFIQRLRQR